MNTWRSSRQRERRVEIVGESYPFQRTLFTDIDNHNSVNGIRELPTPAAREVKYIPIALPICASTLQHLDRELAQP